MGTRNLTCVVEDNKFKLAQYCQWDGYPSGQGKTIRDFIVRKLNKKIFIRELNKLKELTVDELNKRWEEVDEKSVEMKETYPALSRDTGAKILYMIQRKKIKEVFSDLDFTKDSLFCEYCYVIDLDNDILEIYRGYCQEPPLQEDRFSSNALPEEGYYPVQLRKKFKFSELKPLPKYFLDK